MYMTSLNINEIIQQIIANEEVSAQKPTHTIIAGKTHGTTRKLIEIQNELLAIFFLQKYLFNRTVEKKFEKTTS